jgi:hypothetical protein
MVAFPWLWGRWVWTYYIEVTEAGAVTCYPQYFIFVVVVVGLVFHGLNVYWMNIIIIGAAKKIRGSSSEKHTKSKVT